MTRDEAIYEIGLEIIKRLEETPCVDTGRLLDDKSVEEYVAVIRVGHMEISAYYYPSKDDLDTYQDDLSNIDWVVADYRVTHN